MSLIPSGEKIVETKKCRLTGKEFIVTDRDLEFYDKVSPIFAGKKYLIPSPTLCPEERMRRRMVFRNDRNLHKRKCDLSQEEIISCYHPQALFPVYHQKYWYSDSWSPLDFGRNFDFWQKFFDTFHKLSIKVPRPHGNIKNSVNCDYCNYMIDSKNCYLAISSSWSENAFYCFHATHSKDTCDATFSDNLELCYSIFDSFWCYKCMYSDSLRDCRDCYACFDCQNCTDCIFSSNLRNKRFYVFNKEVKESEYRNILGKFLKDASHKGVWSKYLQNRNLAIHKLTKNEHSTNVIWNYLMHCENCFICDELDHAKNCKYSQISAYRGQEYCYDCTGSAWNFCYESMTPLQSNSAIFSDLCVLWHNMYYSALCFSNNCFWCISLHSHEHHCILNKPYSVQEYEQLCWKIIDHMRSTGEWWEFFPHELSPFGYNETVAQEYFPLTESEVKSHGWNWYDEPVKTFEGTFITPLPISEYDEKKVGYDTAQKNIDALLAGVVKCEVTGKPFKIIRQELAFYIEHSLPIPTKHPDQRHKERMDLRNPRTLYERTCAECGTDMITTYSPERPERVVCEECYRKLVY